MNLFEQAVYNAAPGAGCDKGDAAMKVFKRARKGFHQDHRPAFFEIQKAFLALVASGKLVVGKDLLVRQRGE